MRQTRSVVLLDIVKRQPVFVRPAVHLEEVPRLPRPDSQPPPVMGRELPLRDGNRLTQPISDDWRKEPCGDEGERRESDRRTLVPEHEQEAEREQRAGSHLGFEGPKATATVQSGRACGAARCGLPLE